MKRRFRPLTIRVVQSAGLLVLAGSLVSPDVPLDRQPKDPKDPNLFQFVRIRYNGFMSTWGGGRTWVPPWAHDYPRAEKNLLKVLSEVTNIQTTPDSYVILDFDDPRIMDHPFLYVSEPGYWNITQEEADNLREYFRRGGFVVFDDFRGTAEWLNFTSCMAQVFPDRAFEELTLEHSVFRCFYDIETLEMAPPYVLPGQGEPTFYGLSDENGRLQAVANFNNDIGDYWEWSDEDLWPVYRTNEAFKFGVNYIIYALTH